MKWIVTNWWVYVAIVLTAHTFVAFNAWHFRNDASLAILIAVTFLWTGISFMYSREAKNWREFTRHTLGEWQRSNTMSGAYSKLLFESLENLSTWDRESSDEILERARTISLLQLQNIEDNNGHS